MRQFKLNLPAVASPRPRVVQTVLVFLALCWCQACATSPRAATPTATSPEPMRSTNQSGASAHEGSGGGDAQQSALPPRDVSGPGKGSAAGTQPAASPSIQRLADGDLATVASPCGIHLLTSWKGSAISALVAAKDIKSMKPPNPKAWLLDGALVQLELVTAGQLQAETLRNKDLLDRFRERQLSALARINGWQAPQPRVFMSEPTKPGSPLQAQVWAFTAPGKMEVLGVPVTGMTFAAVAIEDLLLIASIPFRPGDDPQSSLQLFVSLLSSIESNKGLPDVTALSEKVRRDSAADPTCTRGSGS